MATTPMVEPPPTNTTTADASALCMLAKRVPKIVKCGDEDTDRKAEEIRTALIGVIQHLNASPDKTIPCLLALTRGDIQVSTSDRHEWSDSYCCIQKYPKYFKAQLLMADSGNSLTQADLNNINTKDSEAICHIFNLCCQTRDSTSTPREIINKIWSSKCFLMRLRFCRHRIRTLKSSGALKADGSLDFTKWGAYTLIWGTAGVATGVRHISGDEATFEAGQVITADWQLVSPTDEMQSKLVKGASCLTLLELFQPGQGPWRFDLGRQKKTQADCFRELSRQLASTPASEHPTGVVPDPKFLAGSDDAIKEVRKAKAKARVESGGPARKKRRTIAIT